MSNKITLYNNFIPHSKIPDIHNQFGMYYAVTRMDAQGVSMCEAMASGLPVVSFDICAIPEYIEDGVTGLLVSPYDVKSAAENILELSINKNLYTTLAENGRKAMEKIDISVTTQKELTLICSIN